MLLTTTIKFLNTLKNTVLLSATSSLKLSSFKLTDQQWDLLDEVSDVLTLFKEMTLYFSQAETPLISDIIGALEDLITAETPVTVAENYSSLNEECEVYAIAIVMSPDKKLHWFRSRGWSEENIERIKNLTVSRWEESYKWSSSAPTAAATPVASTSSPRASSWVAPTTESIPAGLDDIQAYLNEPPMTSTLLKTFGGSINNQEPSTPSLSRLGSDFCSGPTTSVDGERSFSVGRRKLGSMQHNTADQTFQSSMAVGS
ncbi:hypothetical protein B0H13DRAFT_2345689 [Mycena leptocephala]|nr:hypothetical protein B0H13DRAFT_2345689 [Mycena leptocephala]